MFKPGDLVIIKSANDMWKHLVGQIGIFIREDDGIYSHLVKPVHCDYKVKFAEEDLEYLCSSKEIIKILGEENI